MNVELWVKIATGLITICGAVLTYVIVPYYKSKTTAVQREEIEYWVTKAVNAAEQIYKEKGMGLVKKQDVLDFLKSKGYDITDEAIDKLIEAAVKELNESKAAI
jgi:Skp family chaperone for outer membrane proteins